MEDLHLTTESRVCLASVADPFVLVGTEDDDLILVSLRPAPIDEAESEKQQQQQEQPVPRFLMSPDGSGTDFDPSSFFKASESLPFSRFLELSRPKVAQVGSTSTVGFL